MTEEEQASAVVQASEGQEPHNTPAPTTQSQTTAIMIPGPSAAQQAHLLAGGEIAEGPHGIEQRLREYLQSFASIDVHEDVDQGVQTIRALTESTGIEFQEHFWINALTSLVPAPNGIVSGSVNAVLHQWQQLQSVAAHGQVPS